MLCEGSTSVHWSLSGIRKGSLRRARPVGRPRSSSSDNACAGSQAYILLASEFIRRRRTAANPAAQPEADHEPVP